MIGWPQRRRHVIGRSQGRSSAISWFQRRCVELRDSIEVSSAVAVAMVTIDGTQTVRSSLF